MQRRKVGVDIVFDILELLLVAYPESTFIKSLWTQYQERGGLSKKQLEGLYQKALKVEAVPASKLATLEAEILKRPNRFKSPMPEATTLYTKDAEIGEMIEYILKKNPQHRRVLYFKAKYDNNEPMNASELTELKKFHKLFNR